MSHIDPDYPYSWVLVTPQEMVGIFHHPEAAEQWAKQRGLEGCRVERVTFTDRWDQERERLAPPKKPRATKGRKG